MITSFHNIERTRIARIVFLFSLVYFLNTACSKKDDLDRSNYQSVNLVSDVSQYNSERLEQQLQNPWGFIIDPKGAFWISSEHSGETMIFDANGSQIMAPINIEKTAGVVYNGTGDFNIPGKGTSILIFASEEGNISAWNGNSGSTSTIVADRSSDGAVYKGITMASGEGENFIYACDFHNARIDVFDKNFNKVSGKAFYDEEIPGGYAPFNIQNLDGLLYVTYAKRNNLLDNEDEPGNGNGYVNIYTTAGLLLKRFAAKGLLNSPWGITSAPATFGEGTGSILIANSGDGRINVYDINGVYKEQLSNNGFPVSIPGLHAIGFNNYSPADHDMLFFTAGPVSGTHGIFGYVKKM